jgi:iron complex transport system substrate-binding protein
MLLLVLVGLVTAAPGCHAPAGSPAATRAGSGPPRRIVSLVPAVTEMLFAVGAGPQVVAVSSFDTFPPEVRSLTKVGALLDPDVERIIRLRPDLVVVYGTQSDAGEQLARAGIATFPYVLGGLDNLTATIRRLGQAVGRAGDAEAAAAGIEGRLAAIGRRVANLPRPRVLLVFGREPGTLRSIDASGGVGFLADIIRLAGGENVFESEKRESLRVSTETVLAVSPDVIIDLHYGARLSPERLGQERAAWSALPAVPAVRSGRVALLVGDEFVVPGPRVVDAADAVADALHPGSRR